MAVVTAWTDFVSEFGNINITVRGSDNEPQSLSLMQSLNTGTKILPQHIDEKYSITSSQILSENMEEYEESNEVKDFYAYNLTTELVLNVDGNDIYLIVPALIRRRYHLNQKMCRIKG